MKYLRAKSCLSLALMAALSFVAAAIPTQASVDDCIDVSQTDAAAGAIVETFTEGVPRCGNQFVFKSIPKSLQGLPYVSVKRGAKEEPGIAYTFTLKRPATVYLFVMENGKPTLSPEWKPTEMKALWGFDQDMSLLDSVYSRHFDAGPVTIPAHDGQAGNFGVPHLCVISCD